jgi:hypothetical protein
MRTFSSLNSQSMKPENRLRIAKMLTVVAMLLVSVGCFLGLNLRAQAPPRYKFDPSWPKTLPNKWIFGTVQGVVADKDGHIWVLQYPRSIPSDDLGAAQDPPSSECCIAAPAVIEFDADGNVLKSWGGPGYVPNWPTIEKGLWVDKKGNVWISGVYADEMALSANFPPKESLQWDRQVLKFSGDGKLLLQIGRPAKDPINNQDTTILGGPASIRVDDDNDEVYIADGFMNKRIVVYDSNTGAFKRGWGAYGIPLSEIDNARPAAFPQLGASSTIPPYDPSAPPSKQFRGPVDPLALSSDGLVYVGDRGNDRIQIFTKQGKFVKELFVAPNTLRSGSVWAITFSHDSRQKYLLVGDGANNVIWVLNRDDGSVVGTIGHKGHNGGEFDKIETMNLDTQGNLYVGEARFNNRVQRFTLEK